MTQERMKRDEFFTKIGRLDEGELRKALWALYWRGTAPMKDRIEDVLEPAKKEARERAAQLPPEAKDVLGEIHEFADLAREGAYLAGDRRVSPKERTRWRITFRRLASQAQEALRGDDVESAATALGILIDLACESRGLDYFRSEDPMEAARFVVSDAVDMLWSRTREVYAPRTFAEHAASQMLRWEAQYGWTRIGDGWVAERETSLSEVLARHLTVPDLWAEVAEHYLDALDQVAPDGHDREEVYVRRRRAADLAAWHTMLKERLEGTEHEGLLDRLADHPALSDRG